MLASSAYQSYVKRVHGRIKWREEEESPDAIVIAAFEDHPDHFVRGVTLRVHRDGRVYVKTSDGEWVEETLPRQ